jgi:glutamate-1-semialdehyde 2,1-aminomutase
MNLVAPLDGFLAALRAECDRVGALLIFDEVITGFRLRLGGAEEYYSVTPDLWCFGKVIGGGLPVGAFGGSKKILASLAPEGPVYQAGTLSGNPLATAAGRCVLELVSPRDLDVLTASVAVFADELRDAIGASGLFALTPTVGPLMGLFLSREECCAPRNFHEAKALCENGLYKAFFHEMLERGIALAPGAYEIVFTSLAHSRDDLATTVACALEAAAVTAKVATS